MKRTRTRILSTILSLALVTSLFGIPAFAAEGDEASSDSTQATIDEATDKSLDENAQEDGSETDLSDEATDEEASDDATKTVPSEETTEDDQNLTNKVSIEIFDQRPFIEGSELHFQIALGEHGVDAIDTHHTIDGYYHGLVTFNDVEPGSYDLVVSCPKFKDYKQTIYVSDEIGNDGRNIIRSYRVVLYTWDYAIGSGEVNHPGIIFYGDVTGDRAIDNADVDVMIDAIQTGSSESTRDLTGTGTVSLVDLQVLAEAYGREDVLSSTASSMLSHNLNNVEVTEEVVIVEDDPQSLPLQEVIGNPDQESSVKVKTKSNEPISQEHPVSLVFNNLQDVSNDGVEAMVIKPPHVESADATTDTRPREGTITAEYDDANGFTQYLEFTFRDQNEVSTLSERAQNIAQALGIIPEKAYADQAASAVIDSNGNIIVDFGRKIAIKKVTLKITKVANENLNLAEISSVEFLNEMQDRIPAPEMNIPTGLTGKPGSKEFSISWNPEPEGNVHGYEVFIEANGKHQIMTTKNSNLVVTEFAYGKKGKVENGVTYTVKVQSMNGQWRSGWCDPITVKPMATKVPDPPENVNATPGYKYITVSWKMMEDTDKHTIHYSVKGSNDWKTITDVTTNSYQISNLLDRTTYQVYVTGINAIGESRPSDTASATTTTIDPAELPTYRLINSQTSDGRYMNNIAGVRAISGTMVDSPLDTNGTALGIFDNDYTSYMMKQDWDMGCAYNAGNHGVEVSFTTPQTIGFVSFAASTQNLEYSAIKLFARNAEGVMTAVNNISYTYQTCSNGRRYVLVRIPGGVTTDQILLGMSRYVRYIDIAEMRIHGYNDIEDRINDLYGDDMHITLKQSVRDNPAIFEELQTQLDTPEPNGDYYPYRASAQRELDFAKKLYEDEQAGLGEVIKIHTELNDSADNGKNLGIGGLNAWQPIGKVAAANDTIIAYVASPNVKTVGNTSNSKVQIYVGQHYAESSNPPSYGGVFPVGRQQYSVPQRVTKDTAERGSQLYVQYAGSNTNEEWYIRVMGATSSPYLDLYKDHDPASRAAKAEKYINALDERVDELAQAKADEAAHDALHSESVNDLGEQNVNVFENDYADASCILNSTEIMTDYMLYSVAATKAISACGSRTDPMATRVSKLLATMDGTDQLMTLFYQHKGLAAEGMGAAKANTVPARHLNIRQMRMFAGAFMYASGNHIGVDYQQSGNFAGLRPISDAATAPGATRSQGDGNYFGWGVAHEIGHNINDGRYSYAEVTNNYFAQLCRMINDGTTRFTYDKVYDRVTSGAKGRSGNVFTQLAMYWQLMLAHDNNEIYTIYNDPDSIFANRIVARMDSYARVPASAPAPDGVALALDGGESQNVIRLASAAAQKNLAKFFTCWGLVPNEQTMRYISQFPEETRALQYVTDDAVKWTRANPGAAKVASRDVVAASVSQKDNLVTVTVSTTDPACANSLLGYEISRVTYAEGKPSSEIVGFATTTDGSATFVDNAGFLGNRAVIYSVKAVDKFLNYSNEFKTDQIKLNGAGMYNQKDWAASSNMTSDQDQVQATVPVEGDFECADELSKNTVSAVERLVSGSLETDFTGTAADADPWIAIDMRQARAISSIRYTPAQTGTPITGYKIESSLDNMKFTQIASGTFSVDPKNGYAQIYFYGQSEEGGVSNPWITTETARYLRITAVGAQGQKIGIGSINVFGPSGDDVDFLAVEGEEDVPVIGVLGEDYQLEAGDHHPENVIPAGSIVFTGRYKGNPAYNVVVLYDEAGKIVGGTKVVGDSEELIAEQVILAEDPGNALLGETSDGRWVYWISPDNQIQGKVRAELYRVDNALTNEGQRLVADSLYVSIPTTLPTIVFKAN